mmetsp:Transcript_3673/g.3601  ORF Transcript_3673/g.3601 Transcript_3673/m.3601 type:complete len:168 (+) Transcript_3673:1103-1606(+)
MRLLRVPQLIGGAVLDGLVDVLVIEGDVLTVLVAVRGQLVLAEVHRMVQIVHLIVHFYLFLVFISYGPVLLFEFIDHLLELVLLLLHLGQFFVFLISHLLQLVLYRGNLLVMPLLLIPQSRILIFELFHSPFKVVQVYFHLMLESDVPSDISLKLLEHLFILFGWLF